MRIIKHSLFKCLPLIVVFCCGTASAEIIGRASVIDGDTIEIRGERIRLFGIDAPESRQTCYKSDMDPWRCGTEAANVLDRYLINQTVRCVQLDTDQYQRVVAKCYRGDVDLGAWLVRQGLAVAFRRYSDDYVQHEAFAKAKKRGMWAGFFDLPETVRNLKR